MPNSEEKINKLSDDMSEVKVYIAELHESVTGKISGNGLAQRVKDNEEATKENTEYITKDKTFKGFAKASGAVIIAGLGWIIGKAWDILVG
jgi:hypothetical protein